MAGDATAPLLELIAAARPCLTNVDRDLVDANVAAGEYFFAADDALNAAVRHGYALPVAVLLRVREWFEPIRLNDPEQRDTVRFDRLLREAERERR